MEVISDYAMCVCSAMTQHILCFSNESLSCRCDYRNAGLALRCTPSVCSAWVLWATGTYVC